MDNLIVTDENTEMNGDTLARTGGVDFTIGVNPDQNNFNDDDENLVDSNHYADTFSDDELHSPVEFRRKPTYDTDFWWKASEIEGLGQYDDFHTIDWCKDRARDKMRYRKVRQMKMTGTWFEKLKAIIFNFYLLNSVQFYVKFGTSRFTLNLGFVASE